MNLGIVGLGWWGTTLVESLRASETLRFVAAFNRSRSPRSQEFAAAHALRLHDSYEALLADSSVDAVALATPPAGHAEQILAAVAAGKHVFCEKPFVMSADEARGCLAAAKARGLTIGVGYNRRFHPSWIDLKQRIGADELGTILHVECTMSGPNGLSMAANAWRASRAESPCGGLFPLGVHAIDGVIDLLGDFQEVYCQSFRRAVPNDNDDTTSLLFRLACGASGYLATLMATVGSFRFEVFGSKAAALLGGSTHVAGQSSQQRRTGLFGQYVLRPVKGDATVFEVPVFDVNCAELTAFAAAASGGPAFPITPAQILHGVAVTDAVIRASRSHSIERVENSQLQ